VELDVNIGGQETQKGLLSQNIEKLEEKGNDQRAIITNLKNENDDLK
jgi:hypothetical protein